MPKIIGSSLDEHRTQIHRRVLDAFAGLLTDRGYDAISMADVAAAAGIGRTVIYNHFPDKDAIVVALAGDETDRYLARLGGALAEVDGPVEQLRAYVRHHRASADEFHLGLGAELYVMLSKDSLAEIRAHVVEVESVLRSILRAGVESGDFRIDDLDATVSLVHACLQPRHLATDAVEAYVLRGVGAAV